MPFEGGRPGSQAARRRALEIAVSQAFMGNLLE
jgi:hypothetical protein